MSAIGVTGVHPTTNAVERLAIETSAAPLSSGTTPLATTTAEVVVTALVANASRVYHHVRIVNEGTVAGFYSLDGGTTWLRLPSQCVITDDNVTVDNVAIQIKVTGADDLGSVYASAW